MRIFLNLNLILTRGAGIPSQVCHARMAQESRIKNQEYISLMRPNTE